MYIFVRKQKLICIIWICVPFLFLRFEQFCSACSASVGRDLDFEEWVGWAFCSIKDIILSFGEVKTCQLRAIVNDQILLELARIRQDRDKSILVSFLEIESGNVELTLRRYSDCSRSQPSWELVEDTCVVDSAGVDDDSEDSVHQSFSNVQDILTRAQGNAWWVS